MEPSEQGTTSQGSNGHDHDPRLDLLKQKYTRLAGQIQSANSQYASKEDKTLNVFKLIDGTYFYESLAQFGFNSRLNSFYSSLKVGDRFVAKVVGVFERAADVVLVWSSRRDICDLKIKAYLRLVEQKRYNNGNRYAKYPRQNSSVMIDKNIEVSELIFVELAQFNKINQKIEVIRCKSLTNDDTPEDDNEEDDGLLNEEKYKSKSPSQLSFHDYMIDHDHLRNPSLIKQPTFTSLLYESQVAESYQRKLKEKNIQHNKAPNLSVPIDNDVILLDDRKPYKQNTTRDGTLDYNKFAIAQSATAKPVIYSEFEGNHSISREVKSENLKRNHSLSNFTPNSLNDSTRRSKYSSSSSSSSSSSDSESDSTSSSSDEYRKRHKRKYKRSKSSHERRQHKKKSKKHSRKTKKKKSKKSKDRHHRRDSSPYKKKKIDNKILELLKFT